MSLSRKSLHLLVVLALVLMASAIAPPAEAAVVKPFQLNYDDVVYGDFLYAGNGVVRCPVDADNAPTTGSGNTPATCANTADRRDTLVNDNFFMQWADVDADRGTFDSAKAKVTIPPGAKILFARLNWAGNTGAYTTSPGVLSATKMCQSRNNNTAAIAPPGTPAKQDVRLTVGAGKSVDVPPAVYTEDPLDTFSGGQYYSAYADVTKQFADAPTGSALDLTVGNVWAPKGFNCMGGWSVALVYAYPERNADYAPNKREVFIYDGHVRQNSTDKPTNTTITGFRAAAADAHVGVTAYEGDWGISGDQFLINDKPAAEPSAGGTSNFFISNADGAGDPAVKNNFSVDAKSFNVDTIPAGATSAKLGFATSGDSYLAQNLAFSTPVPELQISKRAEPAQVHPGEPVTFTIVVTNPSGAPASGVKVADDAFPLCSKDIGTLKGGQTVSYTCTATAPDKDFTNTAKATGTSALGDPLDGTATTSVNVIHPAIGITKIADKPAYRAGDTVTFTLKVTNTGDANLTALQVTDPKTPSCAQRLAGVLKPGETRTLTCTTKAPVADGVNTATASGVDGLGKQVTATADAPAPTIAPAIDVTKTAGPTVIHAGEAVTWTITVKNTGDSPLAPVKLTDDTTTSCSRTIDSLDAGASQTYTCAANPSKTTTNTVTATGTDRSGQPVTDTAKATVTVISPALTITKDASPTTVRTGDQITFTITVTNSGDVPLTDVAVADDRTPACAKTFGTLAPQAKQTYTCTAPAPADDFTNTATATGKDQLGREVKVTDDAVVDVIHPAIAIVKDATPAQVREGDTVTWTITVTNTGDVPLTDVAVADDQVAPCAKPLGTLAPQAKQTYTCTTVAGTAGFTNTAKATGTDPAKRPVDASDDASFTVQHPAVTITKDVTGGPFRQGDTVPFRITVRNTGDVPLTGVRVADALVAGCAQTFDGTLEPGGTWGFGCTGTAPADDFTNTAQVTGTPPVGPAVTAIDTAAVDVIHPGIAITKDADPKVVRAGDTVTFTLTVTNTGDSPLRDVFVADQLAPECAQRLGTLAPQAKQTYTCTLVVGEADFTNTATANGTDGTNRPVTSTAEAAVDVIHPAISITKDAAPAQVRVGDTVTFTIVVKNTGDVPLTDVSVVDSQTPSCAQTIGSLLPGAEQHHSCTVTAGTDSFTNTATATGTDPTDRQVTATDNASYTVLHPGLAITKDVKGGPFREGDAVTFTITVENTGDAPLTAVTVTDELAPACAKTFETLAPKEKQTYDCTMTAPADDVVNRAEVTGQPPTGPPLDADDTAEVDVIHPAVKITKEASPTTVREGDEVTFTIVVTNTGDVPLSTVVVTDDRTPACAKTFDTLALAGVQTYTCTTKAPSDDFTNTAGVTGTDPTGRPVTSTATAAVDVIHPQLALMKDATPYEVREGDTVTFAILVKNTGDVPLTDVTVADDRTPACAHTVATLAPDAEETYTCTTVAGRDGFTNTATATGQDPTNRPVTATGSATFVVQHPGLSITKNVRGGPFRTGDSVPFDIVVTNTGDVDLHSVTVADTIAPECVRGIGVLPAKGVERYECTMTAPADDVTNVAKVTGTPPTGDLVTSEAQADVDVIHPAVKIDKSVSPAQVRPGDEVTYTIVVTNTGDVPLSTVAVTDDKTPACAFTVAKLDVGGKETHQCSATVREDVTNVASVTGDDPTGRPVTATDDAGVDVIGPGITVTKTGPAKPLLPGQDAVFTVVAKNTGDVALTGVTLNDPIAPKCSVEIGTLAPGESSKPISCSVTMGDDDVTNTVTATGHDPNGNPVTATDEAPAKVAKPAIDLQKKADPTIRPGGTVTFTLVVRNTGNVELVDVDVTDPAYPACARKFPRLPVAGQQEWTCTTIAPASGAVSNTATATGTPDTEQPGKPVRDSASTAVRVVTTPVPPGQDPDPTPLPNTGYDPVPAGLTALSLLGCGVLLLLGVRRSRRS